MKIGAPAQRRIVGILLDDLVGIAVDLLIDNRARGAVKEGLVRDEIAWLLLRRVVARARASVGHGHALVRRQRGLPGVAGCLAPRRCNDDGSRRPHRLDAEIRTHGSLLASLESNPNPSNNQL